MTPREDVRRPRIRKENIAAAMRRWRPGWDFDTWPLWPWSPRELSHAISGCRPGAVGELRSGDVSDGESGGGIVEAAKGVSV
jgi:hypothetical protein